MLTFFSFLILIALGACGSPQNAAPPDAANPPLSQQPVEVPPPPQPSGDDPFADLLEYGDVVRGGIDVTGFLDDPKLTAVTREMGPSVISTRQLPYRSNVAQARQKAWSSWWFPKKEKFLFSGTNSKPSTLGKLDYFQRSRGRTSGSALEWEKKAYNPEAQAWEGLCDAWALAAISTPEPVRPVAVTAGNTRLHFGVSELKGLLLKTYEAVEEGGLLYYGQRFTGGHDGWIHPDLFPEQFHRFVEVQLFEKQEGFVMDHDPGPEVWSVPVYKANYTMEAVAGQADAVYVRMWLYSAAPLKPDDREAVGTQEVLREYAYVLKGTRNAHGDLVATSGYWTTNSSGIDSRRSHPDFFIRIPDPSRIVRKSWNPNIETSSVDEILRSAR